MRDGPEASYEGEYAGEIYTVQVFPVAGAIAPRGKRQVLLRIRFRGITEDLVELVPRSFTEVFIHTAVRRLIGEAWPS
jgi:hypothetical protein